MSFTKLNYLSRLLVVGLLALAATSAWADEEQNLIKILLSGVSAPEKCSACQKLRTVGTAESVPALSALLGDERVSQAARYALEGMPAPEAEKALRQALKTTSGPLQAGVADSVGWRRDTAAVPLLKTLLRGTNVTVASAAATALSRIGNRQAAAALSSARDKVPPGVQPSVLNGILQCAELRLAARDAKGAASLYRELFATNYPGPVRVAAWRGLVLADTQQRGKMVSQALAGEDRSLQVAAQKAVRELGDAAVVKECLRQWAVLPASSQLAVLDARLKVGGDVVPTVRLASQSSYAPVRVAAWLALADLGEASAIPALAKAAARGEPAERDAARDTLTRLRGPGVREALLSDLAEAQPQEKAELLRALGDRGDTGASGVLLQNASGGPEPVRLAALDSLRKIASLDTLTSLLELAAKSPSDAECEPVMKAAYAVCGATHDKDQTTRNVLEAMRRMSPAQRCRVLPVLAELGTPAGLEAALAATREPDAELAKQAVRVLAQWPNAAPAARLLDLAREESSSPSLQVLALRGSIEVAGLEPDLAKRLALLQQARSAATRPDEKKQALGQIGQIPTAEALEVAMADLADAELANEAGLAAITIAEKLAATNPKLAEDTAAKVLAQGKVPEVTKRAWAIRSKAVGTGPSIQDWLVCGPYTQSGVNGALALFNIAFGPEKPGEKVEWIAIPRADPNLASLFPGRENCAAYLRTQIIAPKDCDGALLLGSDDGVKAWLNGAVVHSNNVDRGDVPDQDIAPIHLKQGTNDLMLKITQGGGGWSAHARIVGSDGHPIKGLRVEPKAPVQTPARVP